jgi:hypothetical protein
VTKFREIPELYDIARQITNDMGMTWTDPRNGKHHPPPAKPKAKRKTKRRKSK